MWTWDIDVQFQWTSISLREFQSCALLLLDSSTASTQEISKKLYQHIQIIIYHPLTLHRLRRASRTDTHTHACKYAKISKTDNRILHCKFLLYFYNPGMRVPPKFLAYTGWAELTNCCLQIWSALSQGPWICTKVESKFQVASGRYCYVT